MRLLWLGLLALLTACGLAAPIDFSAPPTAPFAPLARHAAELTLSAPGASVLADDDLPAASIHRRHGYRRYCGNSTYARQGNNGGFACPPSGFRGGNGGGFNGNGNGGFNGNGNGGFNGGNQGGNPGFNNGGNQGGFQGGNRGFQGGNNGFSNNGNGFNGGNNGFQGGNNGFNGGNNGFNGGNNGFNGGNNNGFQGGNNGFNNGNNGNGFNNGFNGNHGGGNIGHPHGSHVRRQTAAAVPDDDPDAITPAPPRFGYEYVPRPRTAKVHFSPGLEIVSPPPPHVHTITQWWNKIKGWMGMGGTWRERLDRTMEKNRAITAKYKEKYGRIEKRHGAGAGAGTGYSEESIVALGYDFGHAVTYSNPGVDGHAASPDAHGVSPDASPKAVHTSSTVVDASPSLPDAHAAAPDASTSNVHAASTEVDASPSSPDACGASPDACGASPDTSSSDAHTSPSGPDALAPSPDASAHDHTVNFLVHGHHSNTTHGHKDVAAHGHGHAAHDDVDSHGDENRDSDYYESDSGSDADERGDVDGSDTEGSDNEDESHSAPIFYGHRGAEGESRGQEEHGHESHGREEHGQGSGCPHGQKSGCPQGHGAPAPPPQAAPAPSEPEHAAPVPAPTPAVPKPPHRPSHDFPAWVPTVPHSPKGRFEGKIPMPPCHYPGVISRPGDRRQMHGSPECERFGHGGKGHGEHGVTGGGVAHGMPEPHGMPEQHAPQHEPHHEPHHDVSFLGAPEEVTDEDEVEVGGYAEESAHGEEGPAYGEDDDEDDEESGHGAPGLGEHPPTPPTRVVPKVVPKVVNVSAATRGEGVRHMSLVVAVAAVLVAWMVV